MDVLKRKTRKEPGVPDYLTGQSPVWAALHLAACDALSSLTGGYWKSVKRDVEADEIKTLAQGLPMQGLFYGFSNALDTFPVFLSFQDTLAACVSSGALATPSQLTGGTYQPELLDLLLFKPIVDVIEEELNKLLISIISTRMEVRQVWEGVTSRDLKLPRGSTVWNEVKFQIQYHQPEDIEPKMDSALIELCQKPLTFSLLMPQPITQQLMSHVVAEDEDVMSADIDSPWAEHMSRAVEDAPIPVRAVIESCRMTVADCTRLQIGDVIDLPGVSLQSVSVQTDMLDGPEKIASAALGIYKSHRALKLTEDLMLSHSPQAEIIDL